MVDRFEYQRHFAKPDILVVGTADDEPRFRDIPGTVLVDNQIWKGLGDEGAMPNVMRCGKLVLADGRWLPIKTKSFETVVAAEVLEHIPEQEVPGFLLELERVARGRIIITAPQDPDALIGKGYHVTYVTRHKMLRWLLPLFDVGWTLLHYQYIKQYPLPDNVIGWGHWLCLEYEPRFGEHAV